MEQHVKAPKMLKRTISKCHMSSSSGSSCAKSNMMMKSEIGYKKVATIYQAGPTATDDHMMHGQAKEQPVDPQESLPRSVHDEEEAVLLPRVIRPFEEDDYDDYDEQMHGNSRYNDDEEPELSPLPFPWHDSPVAADERYYASVLEATALVSPSPNHVFYAATPNSCHDTASTISLMSSSTISSLSSPALYGGPAPPTEQDYLSATKLYSLVLDYIDEVCACWNRAAMLTFDQLGQMVKSFPSAFRYIQTVVRDRLGVSWHLVESFVENMLDFICDEDIRDGTIGELAGFLNQMRVNVHEYVVMGNIFHHLCEFFGHVLAKFKKYLINAWLQTKKIEFPCEFGKKSNALFLCMECHREHQ